MSQLKTHIDTLTKKELDAFAQEFYGVNLDQRKSKGAMAKVLIEAADVTVPLKQLPWEELLIEEIKELETIEPEVIEPEVIEPEVIVPELDLTQITEPDLAPALEVAEDFKPLPQPFKNGAKRFMVVPIDAVESYQKLAAGDIEISAVLASSRRAVESIIFYVERDGEVLVRESRNSRFITLK
ncbi:hypothetical protein NVP1081O_013 [Vibrio phage 1.081.O._10N.286.52.C2]|nr:hypothetical protein NVP1081O_013 [Vibrio phage 1.081.O._10N.286.52.C2]